MKLNLIGLLALLVCGAAMAAQDTDIDPRQVRDPKMLETWLDANAADAQSRLATIETTMPSATLVSNKYLKVWAANGSLTTSNLTSAVAIPVTSGGSGAATFTDGGILLGSGTGAFTALGAASNGQIPIGDGTTDPVLATISGTADEVDVSNGAGTITIGIVNPLSAAKGGTGAATLTEGGMLCGGGSGAITALGVAANGQIPIGDGTTAPTLATITATAGETEISNGAGTITVGLPAAVTGVTTFSNATAKAYIQTLEVVSGGAVTVPAGSIAVAALAAGLAKNATSSTTDLRIRYGTATNAQSVSWGETFTALVWAGIMSDITGTNNYFSAVSTSGGTAVVAASHTNRWIAIGR
jgi:hypothetical protein